MPTYVVTVTLQDEDADYANSLAEAIRQSLVGKRGGFVIRDDVEVTVSIYRMHAA